MSESVSSSRAHEQFIRRLELIAALTQGEREVLGALPLELRDFPENSDMVSEGDRPTHCLLLVGGFACRYKTLTDGQRTIMDFHMAGDVPDLLTLHLPKMDHNVGTLTAVTAAFIPHRALNEAIAAQPRLGSVFWRETLIQSAIFREWLVVVGRRTGHQRVAHLICDMHRRMTAIGLASPAELPLPITQIEIGDALGLSSVHVNRVLQDLRRDGFIAGQGRVLQIPDWHRLEQFAEFDPAYLHLKPMPMADDH